MKTLIDKILEADKVTLSKLAFNLKEEEWDYFKAYYNAVKLLLNYDSSLENRFNKLQKFYDEHLKFYTSIDLKLLNDIMKELS